MYAVIRTGGKQYRVKEGDVIEVEHLSSKSNRATFAPILVVTDDGKTIYGRKELKSYAVSAKIVGDAKGDKVNVLKYRPKSGYTARSGHRQLYSLIEISSIGAKGAGKAKTEVTEAEPEEPQAGETVEEPEESQAGETVEEAAAEKSDASD